MKKNFFKKLSFVLALAMIVSVVAPAAGAFAATAPKLNSTKEYLYLDKDGDSEFNFNLSTKKGEGWKYAWTSSKKAVATVNAKNGVVTAVGAGTTTIALAIKDKDGVKVGTAKASVTVRDNIKTLAITNLPTAAVTVGEDHDFNRSYTTDSSRTTGSESVTRWVVNSDKATISDKGVFSATVAGEYTITARAFQSVSKYNTWKDAPEANAALVLATAETKVKAVAQMESATQIDIDTVDVKFTAPTTDVAKNISLYAVVGTTEVKVTTIKEVKMNATNTVASVTLYVPFAEGTTYIVKYTDMKNAQFVSATTKPEDVVGIKIVTTEAVIGKETEIKVSLLNKDGVDIKTTSLLNRVYDYKSSSNKAVLSGDKLYMFNKGDETIVSATFHGQKWDTLGNELGNLTASGNVVAVDAASLVAGAVKAWTIIKDTATPNYGDVKQKLAANDVNMKLYVQLNKTQGTDTGVIESNKAEEVANKNFHFTSSDNSVLVVYDNGYLYPVKAGTVAVVVKYGDKVVDAINITVGADRKAVVLEVSSSTVALSNSTSVDDAAEVTVKAKDQLGDEIAVADLQIEKMVGSPDTKIGEITTTNKTITFSGTTAAGTAEAKEGLYQYKVTANGLTRFVTVTVSKPSSVTPGAFNLSISKTDADSNSVKGDPAGNIATVRPFITIDLFGYAATKTTHPAVSGDGFVVKVTNPDNVTTTVDVKPGQLYAQYELTTVTGSGILGKIKNGTYSVTAYDATGKAVDTDLFTVKDTQVKPVLAEVLYSTYTTGSTTDIARHCFKVTFKGDDVTKDITMGDIAGDFSTGTRVWVKNVKYVETIEAIGGTTYTLEHTIDINQYIDKE